MPRRRRTGNRSFPKRSTLWLPFEVFATNATAGTVVATGDMLANYFGQTGEEVPIGTTIGPIRWAAGMSPLVVTTIDLNYRLEMAMQLVPEGGRATLPSPGTDIMDGMWYGQLLYDKQLIESASGVFNAPTQVKEFETHAMRKVQGNGQELKIYMVANSNVDYVTTHIGVLMLKLP